MARIDFRRFSSPGTLKRIEVDRLRQFLHLVGGSYVYEHVDLEAKPLDYRRIAERISSPGDGYPDRLADALYYADSFSRDKGALEQLVEEAQQRGLLPLLWAEQSAEDLVIRLWLEEEGQELARRVHAEYCTVKPRTFEAYFPDDDTESAKPDLSDGALQALEANLDRYFAEKRGRAAGEDQDVTAGVRVLRVDKASSTWFIIRKPAPWERRVYVADDGSDEMKQGHPEVYDVVVYHPQRDELSIHAKTKGETEAYRHAFGACLFGERGRFSEPGRVSLEPLRSARRRALLVDDIDGIEEITLVELEFRWNNDLADVEIRRSKDLFSTFQRRRMPPPPIRRAVFQIRFTGSDASHRVRIYQGSRSSYQREAGHDSVKEWLVARGFLKLTAYIPPAALRDLWEAVAIEHDTVMNRQEWEARLGEGQHPAATYLALAGGPAPTAPCGLGPEQGCRRSLIDPPSEAPFTYRCDGEDVRCRALHLTKSEAAGYRLDVEAVARDLAAGLRTEEEPARLLEDIPLWRLGDHVLEHMRLPCWFLASTSPAEVMEAGRLARQELDSRTQVALLLVPSTRELTDAIVDALANDDVGVLALDKVGGVVEGHVRIDLWPLVERFPTVLGDEDLYELSGRRYDLILYPKRNRYWCFGKRVEFGPLAQIPPALLREFGRRPGELVGFEAFQAAHDDLVPPTSKGSWKKYKQQLVEALRAGRKRGEFKVLKGLIEAGPGGTYKLNLHPSRVLWFGNSRHR